ncbi:MAG: outer membrane protein [Pseudoalteromonas rhizosphaerae]|uniref:OmpH family outer membrane protein n=1 Tax=Pseudoalteromonas neustonica TaxID=1840331 RepID=A0ABY3FAS8_9GAMM|nr:MULTISPECIES: OmpH family outer membrane protein [Pseudoalteromonas]MBB1293706.1 OmpH family outer membrane protein [Pseudoalteromonas sp. SR41-4]MBB1301263.1 OmpH family outer membrane protein [Pseudoalteromonas sp. SR44-8]MBB1310315.1 OmpH family outer membrane protein [Pseudoalteromonas sp. SR41-8]MBB1397819.1 OmpH family outer membrane protein [Pseudoalteromonas sp. SG44-8]MBB1410160.1 OmpH family outer membrane protein [Pseudoalteromonas sp. SG44-17]
MKKSFKSSAIAILATLMMGTSASAFAHKVGIVDMQEIYKQIPQMAKVEQTLQAEFAERRQELEKLQGDIRFEAEKFKRESTTMSQAQKDALREKVEGMQKNLAEKGRPLEQEIKVRQNQELAKVQGLIIKAIEDIAKDGKYDEVKVKDTTIYFNPKTVVDLSSKVVDQVSKQ